VFEAKMKTQYS